MWCVDVPPSAFQELVLEMSAWSLLIQTIAGIRWRSSWRTKATVFSGARMFPSWRDLTPSMWPLLGSRFPEALSLSTSQRVSWSSLCWDLILFCVLESWFCETCRYFDFTYHPVWRCSSSFNLRFLNLLITFWSERVRLVSENQLKVVLDCVVLLGPPLIHWQSWTWM